MRILYLAEGDALQEPSVICLGFFDGVHIGHVRLIEKAGEIAGERGLVTCVHTFDEMPARVLQPDWSGLELTPLDEKIRILGGLAVGAVAVSSFRETMTMRADDFFRQVLVQRLSARHIVAGFHHRFGYKGEGDVNTLSALCKAEGIRLDIIDAVTLPGGELVSSTAIRDAIRSGNFQRASRMLGRPVKK